MIEIECQSCRQRLSVPDSLAGDFEACPSCRSLVAVPGPYKPDVPASWSVGRSISTRAEKLRQAQSGARKLIWGFAAAAMGFAVLGLVAAATFSWQTGELLWMLAMGAMGICALIAFAAMPGAIARSRGLANADGINILGALGIFIPIVWLVALVLAFVTAPPTGSR